MNVQLEYLFVILPICNLPFCPHKFYWHFPSPYSCPQVWQINVIALCSPTFGAPWKNRSPYSTLVFCGVSHTCVCVVWWLSIFFTTVVDCNLTSVSINKEASKECVMFNSSEQLLKRKRQMKMTLNTTKKTVIRITISFYLSAELDLLSTKTEFYKDPTPFVKKWGKNYKYIKGWSKWALFQWPWGKNGMTGNGWNVESIFCVWQSWLFTSYWAPALLGPDFGSSVGFSL